MLLNGAPLISYPLHAMGEALGGAVIVAKADSELPSLPGVEVWIEPDHPRHPLAGLVHAHPHSQGRPVLVCACDLPLVSADLITGLAAAADAGAMAVVAQAGRRIQPLLGCQSAPSAALAGGLAAERDSGPGRGGGARGPASRCRQTPPLLFRMSIRPRISSRRGCF